MKNGGIVQVAGLKAVCVGLRQQAPGLGRVVSEGFQGQGELQGTGIIEPAGLPNPSRSASMSACLSMARVAANRTRRSCQERWGSTAP